MNWPTSSAQSLPPGHRQYLAVLFSDLKGSSGFGRQMEVEDYAALLAQFRSHCRAVVLKHGGLIARIQSDGMLAVFGDSGTREDDNRRAVEAALDLTAAVREIRCAGLPAGFTNLELYSGIHAGQCYVEDGDMERGRLEVLGEVPNTAADLLRLAGPGEILVSEETLGPVADIFEKRVLDKVRVKGRAETMPVCIVLGRSRARTRFEAGEARGLSPFVGRLRELGVLQARLRSALNGSPHTLVIVGSPGVGKTRLLDELARDAVRERCLVLSGFCESYLSAEPLQPFLQIVRSAIGAGERADSEEVGSTSDSVSSVAIAARILGSASQILRAGSTVAGARFSAATTLRDALDALACQMPLLLMIDDWQWADDGSVEVLDMVRTLDRPIFILLATREAQGHELGSIRAEHMRLEPLSKEATQQSVRHLVPGADPFLVDKIADDSGGNPLFIEELCHSAVRAPDDITASRAEAEERTYDRSAWLDSLIGSRMSLLAADDARIVRVASVIGNVIDMDLLSRVVGFAIDEQRVRSLSEQDFLHPIDQTRLLRFKHRITRDAIYERVGLHERVRTHVEVARVLEQAAAEHPEALAYHCAQGQLPMKAARFAEMAGDKAMASHALDRARLHYVTALDALDQIFVPDRAFLMKWCAVAQRLGMACVFDALSLTDATRLLSRGVELAQQTGDAASIARAAYWLAYNCYAKGRGREALEHCHLALDVAESLNDERLTAQLRATLGQICASLGRYEESIPLLEMAIDVKRARAKPGGNIAVGSAFALAIKGSALGDQGRFDLAEECFEEMLQLLEGSSHQVVSSVRNWIGVVYLWQGRWADAVAVVEHSMHVAQNVRSHLLLAFSKAIWGYGQWRLAGTGEAGQAVRDATRWIETRGGALGCSLNYGWLLDLGESHDTDVMRRRHATFLLRRARARDHLGVAMGCRALARCAAKAGDDGAVRRYLERAAIAAESRRSPHERALNQLCLAEVYLLRDRPADASRPLDAACEGFTALSMDWHLRQAERLRTWAGAADALAPR